MFATFGDNFLRRLYTILPYWACLQIVAESVQKSRMMRSAVLVLAVSSLRACIARSSVRLFGLVLVLVLTLTVISNGTSTNNSNSHGNLDVNSQIVLVVILAIPLAIVVVVVVVVEEEEVVLVVVVLLVLEPVLVLVLSVVENGFRSAEKAGS